MEYGPWEGGRPVGGISQKDTAIYLHVGYPHKAIGFRLAKYGSFDEARRAALEQRIILSDERGLTKNKYRRVKDTSSGAEWIEMQLSRGRTCFFDESDLDVIRQHCWSADATRNATRWYAVTTTDRKTRRMHQVLTGYALTDHIDRDGLNNRRSNLREATPATNMRNLKFSVMNRSGRVGVSLPTQGFIRARMRGKPMRCFSIKRYGVEQARAMAIETRRQWEIENGVLSATRLEEGNIQGSSTTILSVEERPRPFRCGMCDNAYIRKAALSQHMKHFHATV
jgi:hypothetical protein